MKKLLLLLMCVLSSVGGWAAASFDNNSNPAVLYTNDDPDVTSLSLADWAISGKTAIQVNGTITQTGLDNFMSAISSAISASNWADLGANAVLDLSNATLSGTITSLGNNTAKSGRFTSAIFPADTDLSGIAFSSDYNYAYSATSGSGPVNLYASANQTTLPNEVSNALSDINTYGISISGDGFDTMKQLLMDQGVSADKIIQPYNGKASVTGGSVASDCATIISDNGIAATDIKQLTVTSGTLTDADVTYITGTLTGLTSIDLSDGTATATQIGDLLDNTTATLTLGSSNIANLQAGSGNVIDMSRIADDITGSSFASGMNNTNYIIDGNTLYVTGNIDSSVDSQISTILSNNPSITKLDVSNATNTSDYEISEKSQLTQVSLPSSGKVTYGGNAITLVDGTLEVNIPTDYASVEAMLNALDGVLSQVEHLKISGTTTVADLKKITNCANDGTGIGEKYTNLKTVDLSEMTVSDGDFTDVFSDGTPVNRSAILLPKGTDLTQFSKNATNNTNLFAMDADNDRQLNVSVNYSSYVGNGAYFATQNNANIVKVVGGKTGSGSAGIKTINALKEYEGVDIVDLTDGEAYTSQGVSAADIDAALADLANFKTVLSPMDANTNQLVVSGPLDNDVLLALSSIAKDNITSIDFSGVTSVDDNIDWSNLTGYDNVEYVMLPAGEDVDGLSTTNLPALKAAGNYDEDTKAAAIHVYQEVTNGAVKGFAATFPIIGQYNQTAAVFNEAESLKLTGTLNANSLVLDDTGNTSPVTGNALKFVDMTETNFESGVTPAASMKVTNNADIIAPNGITTSLALNDYKASNCGNVYSKNGTDMNVLVNNESVIGTRANDYLDGINTLNVLTYSPTTSAGGVNLSNYNNVNVGELDFSGALINNLNQTLANTHITSLVMNGAQSSYGGSYNLDISGCTNLVSADLATESKTLNQVNATGLTNLTTLSLDEGSFKTTVNESSTTLKDGYVDVTGSNIANLTILAGADFNPQRIIPYDQVNIEESVTRPYKVVNCEIVINMPSDGSGSLQDYLTAVAPQAGGCSKLVISGPLTSTDLSSAALSALNVDAIDLSGATLTGTNGTDNTIIGSLSNSHVKYLELPDGIEDKAFMAGIGTNNSNLKVVGSLTHTEEQTWKYTQTSAEGGGVVDQTKERDILTLYSFEEDNVQDYVYAIHNDYCGAPSYQTAMHLDKLSMGGVLGEEDLTVQGNGTRTRIFSSPDLHYFDFEDATFSDLQLTYTTAGAYEATGINSSGRDVEGAQTLTKTVDTNSMYYLRYYNTMQCVLPTGNHDIPPQVFATNDGGWSSPINEINIPGGAGGYTTIGDEAFMGGHLTELDLPNSLTSIGHGAFDSNTLLTSVTMQPLLNNCTLGDNVFASCKRLKTVNLAEKVQNIGDKMFFQCLLLESVRIPNSCKTIGKMAFYECFEMHAITIPEGVEFIDYAAFELSGLTDMYVMATTPATVPKIYAMNSSAEGPSTFTAQRISGNNTDPSGIHGLNSNGTPKITDGSAVVVTDAGFDEVMSWYQEEMSGADGLGTGNCLLALHYPDEMKWFYEGVNPLDHYTNGELDNIPGAANAYGANGWIETKALNQGAINAYYDKVMWDSVTPSSDPNNDYRDFLPEAYGEKGYDLSDPIMGPDQDGHYWPVQTDYWMRTAAGATDKTIAGNVPSQWGWRQFPLSISIGDMGEVPFEREYDYTWYTMCFPWRMTDEQLFQAFQKACEITEFVGVEIIEQEGSTDNDKVYALVLHFDDVAVTRYMDKEREYDRVKIGTRVVSQETRNVYRYTAKDGSKVVTFPLEYKDLDGNTQNSGVTMTETSSAELKSAYAAYLAIQNILAQAGHPYMIHPAVGAAGEPTKVYINGVSIDDGTTPVEVTLAATTGPQNHASELNADAEEYPNTGGATPFVNPKTNGGGSYTFVGYIGDYEREDPDNPGQTIGYKPNDTDDMWTDMPKHSYFLAVKKDKDGNPITGSTSIDQIYPKFYRKPAASTGTWRKYTAVIQPDAYAEDNIEFFMDMAASSAGYNVALGEWEVVTPTAIEQIVAEAEQRNEPVQKIHLNVVYNIKGQVVRNDGNISLEGLPKGLYIVNGKKYMVK